MKANIAKGLLNKTALLFIVFSSFLAIPAKASEWSVWNELVTRVFREFHDLDTYALAIPLYHKQQSLLSAFKPDQNKNAVLLNSDYILVYTPNQAKINDLWYLIEIDRMTEKARIIGKGGTIEYLKSDLYDAPGFDKTDDRKSIPNGLFPQRRVQSSKQIEGGLALHLNGKGDSPTFELLQGQKGWHLLQYFGSSEGNKTTVFDTGEAHYLLEIGKKPQKEINETKHREQGEPQQSVDSGVPSTEPQRLTK